MVEFETIGAPDKSTIIRYFQKDLKPSIKIEIKQQDQALTRLEEIMRKTVNAEAKVGPKSSTMIQNLDICCPRSYCSSYAPFLKVQTQETKKPKPNKFKLKDLKPANKKIFFPSCSKFTKPKKTFCQEKK